MAARPITTAESMPPLKPTTMPRDPALATRAFIHSARSLGRMCIRSGRLEPVSTLDHPEKGIDEHGVELASAFALDLGDGIVDGPRVFIGTLLCERVEYVGDRDDASGERDRLAWDPRITAPVPALL